MTPAILYPRLLIESRPGLRTASSFVDPDAAAAFGHWRCVRSRRAGL